jgi:hypothetical protein
MMKTKNLSGRIEWFWCWKKKVEIVPIDGFELRIVSDETKTKMGKDFYDCIIISIMTIKLMLRKL